MIHLSRCYLNNSMNTEIFSSGSWNVTSLTENESKKLLIRFKSVTNQNGKKHKEVWDEFQEWIRTGNNNLI